MATPRLFRSITLEAPVEYSHTTAAQMQFLNSNERIHTYVRDLDIFISDEGVFLGYAIALGYLLPSFKALSHVRYWPIRIASGSLSELTGD